MPLDWAQTQNNLGTALRTLGAWESGTERLEQAVAAYRAALEEYTRERVPVQWASTQLNLGNAKADLAQRTGEAALFDEALAHYANATEIFAIAAPYYAEVLERNKAITLRQRDELLAKQASEKN